MAALVALEVDLLRIIGSLSSMGTWCPPSLDTVVHDTLCRNVSAEGIGFD